MRILIDPGTLDCRNMGDVAMLQVAVARVVAALPDASLYVFTDDASALARYCPNVHPVAQAGRLAWFSEQGVLGPVHKLVPAPVWRLAVRAQRRLRGRWPNVYEEMARQKERLRQRDDGALVAFLDIIGSAELFLACGQGTLADAGGPQAELLLDTAEVMLRRRSPVLFFGQGVGPLSDAALRQKAGAVLRRAHVVALREGRASLGLLMSLGVANDRLVVTGDDAIQLAYDARSTAPGTGLGIHMRVAPHAIVDPGLIERIRPVLHEAARARGVPLIPLPISHHRTGTYDPGTIRRLMVGHDETSDGGAATDTPLKVIEAVGRCRVVVTGAYHAAVFALSQGIPVVCLGRSSYYIDKFRGLSEQFGAGIEVLTLDDPEVALRLGNAIRAAWDRADVVRSPLLQAAKRQVELGQAAYQRLSAFAGEARPARAEGWR